MPTPELTKLAKEAVAGAEDSMREFLLRADSEYLDQYRTPEMAAEKYVELAEDAAEESGVDLVRETPAAEALDEMNRRRLVRNFDQSLEELGESAVNALEPHDRMMEQTRGFARGAANEGMIRKQMQPGQPMHSASIAIKEGRHDKAAALLEQMLRQDDSATGNSKMSPVARQRTEAMLRTARLVEQSKASDEK